MEVIADKSSGAIISIEVKGVFSVEDMRSCLDTFIAEFVLCQKCKLPELKLQVAKGNLEGLCYSCGELSLINPAHKLTNYLIKNPPKNLRDIQVQEHKEEVLETNETPIRLLKYPARVLVKEFLDNPWLEKSDEFFS